MTTCRSNFRPAPHAAYRRQARRIRSISATAPARRMRALCELSHNEDRARDESPKAPPDPAVTVQQGVAGWFASAVRERMDGPVLRYSQRTQLVRQAEQRGIGRFEANLIIAAVQHQAHAKRNVECVAPPARWSAAIVGFCATQCAIIAGAWWLLG